MAERHDLIAAGAGEAQARSAKEIRQDILEKREQIAETVDRLGDKIQETFDWREYLGRHPYVALGAAAGVGLLVAGIFKRSPTPGERISDALAESVEDLSSRFRDTLGDLPLPAAKKLGPGRTVKAALVAMVTKSAADFLKQRVNTVVVEQWRRYRDGSGPAVVVKDTDEPVVVVKEADEPVINDKIHQGGM
jgi:ElaB/YqjD/DUF883 family membrane-anchored ribosome-binding protein